MHASEALLGGVAAIAITALNILGIRLAARVQAAVVLLILAAGALLAAGGLLHADRIAQHVEVWKGLAGVFAVIIMAPFLFVGFDVIPQSAEEITGDMRDIGRALVTAIALAVAFYMIIVFAVGLAPFDKSASTLATADAAGAWWNSPKASAFLVVAGIGGILTSWNAFLIGGSRAMFALARSGQLPPLLARVHPKFGTPWPAIALIGGLSAFAPLLGRNALTWIVNAGAFGITLAYIFVAASFIRLRIKEPDLPRPYRAPGGAGVGVAALILGLGLLALYLPWSPSALRWPQEWGLLAAWALFGLVLWLIRRGR
ncbi:MAG: hypothetical protein Tsb0010_14120 [Parvularculaceae bacterium]